VAHHRVSSFSAFVVKFDSRPDLCSAAISSIRRFRRARMAAAWRPDGSPAGGAGLGDDCRCRATSDRRIRGLSTRRYRRGL
jgi:hypothetical protein